MVTKRRAVGTCCPSCLKFGLDFNRKPDWPPGIEVKCMRCGWKGTKKALKTPPVDPIRTGQKLGQALRRLPKAFKEESEMLESYSWRLIQAVVESHGQVSAGHEFLVDGFLHLMRARCVYTRVFCERYGTEDMSTKDILALVAADNSVQRQMLYAFKQLKLIPEATGVLEEDDPMGILDKDGAGD